MSRFLPFVCLALPLLAAAQEQQGLSGFEAFAQEPAMSSAAVSPAGTHLATLQRFAKDGKQFLLIYELADMSGRPVTLGSDRMDIVSAAWVNDERLIVRFPPGCRYSAKAGRGHAPGRQAGHRGQAGQALAGNPAQTGRPSQ